MTLDDPARDLQDLFARGVDTPLDDEAFNRWGLRVFAYQFRANPTYRGFCAGRGVSPETVTHWTSIPAVPTTAFKFVELVSATDGAREAVFRTSGTTSGSEVRGTHVVPRMALYRASALPNLHAHLNPDDESLAVLSLIPHPDAAPESSLSTMMGFAAEAWAGSAHWVGHPVDGPDPHAFVVAARQLAKAGAPALVAGTAFAFVHLLDALTELGVSVELPPGSRLMETGGFKGRSRSVERDVLYARLEERLGVSTSRMVNEYGMTELLSQLYEPVLRVGKGGRGVHVPPPWLRVRALDPVTLEPAPQGVPGLLAFFDLANLGSVSHVLTQDLGVMDGRGVRLMGRAPGAEPRGCSLALEDVLAAESRQ